MQFGCVACFLIQFTFIKCPPFRVDFSGTSSAAWRHFYFLSPVITIARPWDSKKCTGKILSAMLMDGWMFPRQEGSHTPSSVFSFLPQKKNFSSKIFSLLVFPHENFSTRNCISFHFRLFYENCLRSRLETRDSDWLNSTNIALIGVSLDCSW